MGVDAKVLRAVTRILYIYARWVVGCRVPRKAGPVLICGPCGLGQHYGRVFLNTNKIKYFGEVSMDNPSTDCKKGFDTCGWHLRKYKAEVPYKAWVV